MKDEIIYCMGQKYRNLKKRDTAIWRDFRFLKSIIALRMRPLKKLEEELLSTVFNDSTRLDLTSN